MDITVNCRLSGALARRMRDEREALTRRWLDRIAARVDLEPNRIFPSPELLDHVPILLDRIADYLEDPSDEISADAPVTAKAIELGELRWSQGFDAHQILKEYEILGGVLFSFMARAVGDIDEECTRAELLACAHRVFRAVSIIEQVTTARYLRLAAERVAEREDRLRGFNRMVSHELKNRIAAILGAAQLLRDPAIVSDAGQRDRFAGMVGENARAMQEVLEDLISLSRMDPGSRRQRNVLLPQVAAEVVRQLREMARAAGVEVRLRSLPEVEVNAAALELCLTNYLSNAIKYADPGRETRWVELAGHVERGGERGPELVVEVADNGRGVAPERRGRLFTRFFRAHDEEEVPVAGTGLGLSIVRETVEALGGRAWADFERPEGSRFLLAVPCRRAGDPSPG